MQRVDTYTAQIFVGLRVGYSDEIADIEFVRAVCRQYVSEVGLCVTVTPTEFIYTPSDECPHYGEPGAIVGLINYPRFSSSSAVIYDHAHALATRLLKTLRQKRITIAGPKSTVMISAT